MSLKSRNINPSAFQRGAASNVNKLSLPSGTLAGLQALSRTEGAVYYATDTDRIYVDTGTALVELQPRTTAEEFSIVSAIILG